MSSNGNDSLISISNNSKWELTLYDQHRTPHEPVDDKSEITVSPRSLNAELICPICLDMLKTTMTTKECLHRFCQDCITTALRSGNKECPTCRKKLVSKRSLRPDPNFDALIAKIYPSREEYDQMQERAIQNLNKHHSTEALQKNIEEGMKQQAELRKIYRVPSLTTDSPADSKTKKRKRDSINGSIAETPNNKDGSATTYETPIPSTLFSKMRSSEIEFILRPHPDLDVISSDIPMHAKQTRYMKTTSNASIDHLSKFIAVRVKLDYEEACRNGNDASFASMISARNEANKIPRQCNGKKPDPPQKTTAENGNEVSELGSTDTELAAVVKDDFECQLYVSKGGASVPPTSMLSKLPGDVTLDHVLTKLWRVKKPLEMHFVLKRIPRKIPVPIVNSSGAGLQPEKSNPNDENVQPK